jgi:hypothetical protein
MDVQHKATCEQIARRSKLKRKRKKERSEKKGATAL